MDTDPLSAHLGYLKERSPAKYSEICARAAAAVERPALPCGPSVALPTPSADAVFVYICICLFLSCFYDYYKLLALLNMFILHIT